jgi:spermidine/putrescine-binding protein
VILKSSKNSAAARLLLNFMLNADANISFVKNVFGSPVLETTKKSLPVGLQANLALFPSAEALARFDRLVDIGDATQLYDRLWAELKSEWRTIVSVKCIVSFSRAFHNSVSPHTRKTISLLLFFTLSGHS